ncbi:hypothetical protein niasHT_009105 [Heterodera trifolii]|uniref:Uncharacterized protein n=1 Tax=Heterodera trifolii TaxID=157864 RepID=A0ABD2M8T3_9BILA
MFMKDEYEKTQIKSLCGTYNSDDVCCRAAYGTPDTCQPTNWAPEKQAIYNALRAANPDGYTYAYDDKTAIKKCSSSSAAITIFYCAQFKHVHFVWLPPPYVREQHTLYNELLPILETVAGEWFIALTTSGRSLVEMWRFGETSQSIADNRRF